MTNVDGNKGMERGIQQKDNIISPILGTGEIWDEEFEDTYTCNWDDLLNEELGLILDNHNLTKLMYDYIKGSKIKIKARKGKIVIEVI